VLICFCVALTKGSLCIAALQTSLDRLAVVEKKKERKGKKLA